MAVPCERRGARVGAGLFFLADVDKVAPDAAVGSAHKISARAEAADQERPELAGHADVIDRHPSREEGPGSVVEIDDGEVAAAGEMVAGGGDGLLEAGVEHGEGVGEEDEVVGSRGGEIGGVGAVGEADSRFKRRGFAAGDFEHGSGEIDSGKVGSGEKAGQSGEVFSGAATYLQDAGGSGEGGDFLEDGAAAEEESPARGVVDFRVEPVVAFDGGAGAFAGGGAEGGTHRTSAKARLP